jgi:hypothetical protein
MAVWPVLSGLVFIFRSLGMAYNEVVVALLDEPRSSKNLRRFTGWLTGAMTLALLLVAATPLSHLWFGTISALPPNLVNIGRIALWLALPQPAMAVYQSWYQGAILHGKVTRGVTEAVLIYLASIAVLLVASVAWGRAIGLYAAMLSMGISMALQTVWMWWRSRDVLHEVAARDAAMVVLSADPQIRATSTSD